MVRCEGSVKGGGRNLKQSSIWNPKQIHFEDNSALLLAPATKSRNSNIEVVQKQMLERVWREENPPILLVGM